MVIGLGIVRNQPWMMGCAKNAMKRTVRRRQILMGPDRAPNEVVANKGLAEKPGTVSARKGRSFKPGHRHAAWETAWWPVRRKIGDALWWGVNCAGRSETPLEMVAVRTAAFTGPRVPTSLQGDDYVLTYDAQRLSELPACLDRGPKPAIGEGCIKRYRGIRTYTGRSQAAKETPQEGMPRRSMKGVPFYGQYQTGPGMTQPMAPRGR